MLRNVLIVFGPIVGMLLLLAVLISNGYNEDGRVVTVSIDDDDGPPDLVEPPEPPAPPSPPGIAQEGASWVAQLGSENLIMIAGSSQRSSRECQPGAKVAVMGNSNSVALTAECEAVLVTGNANRITAESVRKVLLVGNGNSIAAEKVGAVKYRGNGNRIEYGEGLDGRAPEFSGMGRSNQLTRRDD